MVAVPTTLVGTVIPINVVGTTFLIASLKIGQSPKPKSFSDGNEHEHEHHRGGCDHLT